MKIETVPIDSISQDPANVRKHPERNLEAIKASLRRFGQQKPIVVDGNGIVRAGNGTLEAAKSLGWTEIGVVRTALINSEATAYAIADNRLSDLSGWDDDALVLTIKELGIDLADIGFTDDELRKMAPINFEPIILDPEDDRLDRKHFVKCPNCGHTF